MRNYVKVPSASVFGNDGIQDQSLVFFGQRGSQALSIAQITAAGLVASGWPNADASRNPDIYVLLNHDFVTNLIMFSQQGSQPAGGYLGQSLFNDLKSISHQLGLDPFESPKLQNRKPWNGRVRR